MRFLPTPLLAGLLAGLALVPSAWGQEDGCVQSNPCLLDVEVDAAGIASGSISNMTTGDWFTLAISNLDERAHTVRFATIELRVEAYGFVDSQPFQAPSPGAYTLSDQPTGDQATLHVLAGDVVDAENGSTSGSKGSPGFALALSAIAVLCVAALRRRP